MKKVPHTFVIIFTMIVFCGILTWFVPAGEFSHESITVGDTVRDVIVDGSYHEVERKPQTWQIFGAMTEGFKMQAAIIAFVLIIGGAFQIMNSSKAIDHGIRSFVAKSKELEKKKFWRFVGVDRLVMIVSILIFSIFGAIFGMSEETLAFIVLFVPLAISMGYDSLTGLLMVYVSAHVGLSGAIFNPFTIGIAQGLSGIPMFSGFEYRALCWLILTVALIIFTLWYAAKVKANPGFSPMYELDAYWRNREQESADEHPDGKAGIQAWVTYALLSVMLILVAVLYPRTTISIGETMKTFTIMPVIAALHLITGALLLRKSYLYYILDIFAFTIILLVVGVMGYGWYVTEISALFLGMGISSGLVMGAGANKIALEFIAGAKDLLTAALIVGLAGGIIVVLRQGMIMDTILNSLASLMGGTDKGITASIMYGIQTCINIFIPSGSAKAALTMPIMAPFSDLVGLSRQTTVLAYQFGDGFTNMIIPTSAVLMGALGIARVPYDKWFKWFWKVLLFFMVIGLALLLPTAYLSITGF